MRIDAPAKINLHLRVGKPTADGFHPLVSWMATVGLFDKLTFERSSTPGFSLTCDDPAIPADASNLVCKVAQAAIKLHPQPDSVGLSAALQKRIPAGAGLGGGSSDGASALIALNQLLDLKRSAAQLSDLAAGFGSDLSFFFHAPSALCTGRGQFVSPLPRPTPRAVLLFLPDIHMPTPAVYRQFDQINLGDPDALDIPDFAAWASLDALGLLNRLQNDLEAPAFVIRPDLSDLRKKLEQTLARPVRMSGSGSSLFTLYDTLQEAENAAHFPDVRALAVALCP